MVVELECGINGKVLEGGLANGGGGGRGEF